MIKISFRAIYRNSTSLNYGAFIPVKSLPFAGLYRIGWSVHPHSCHRHIYTHYANLILPFITVHQIKTYPNSCTTPKVLTSQHKSIFMKKVSLLLLSALLFTGVVSAQGFFYRLGFGYAFTQAGQINDASEPYSGTVSTNAGVQAYNVKNVSFSSGLTGSLAAGYMFNKNIGVELCATSVFAPKEYSFTASNLIINSVASDLTIVQKANNPLLFLPSLVMQTSGDQLNAYTRFGLALPLKSSVTQDVIVTNLPGTGAINSDDFTFKITSSFSLGFAAAAGIKYKMNSKLNIWGEINLLSLAVLAKEGNLIAFSENGQSYDTSFVSGAKHVKYSKNPMIDSTGNQALTYSMPFSHVGIQFGISYNFGDKSSGDKRKKGGPYKRR